MPLRMLSLVILLFCFHLPVHWSIASATPTSREKLLTVAIGAFNDKLYSFAESQFQEYIASYPRSSDIDRVYYLLGMTYYLQGKLLKAKEVFHKIVNEFPSFQEMGNALFWLGRTWLELGNQEEAATYYRKLVFRHHENEHLADACFDLGYMYVEQKRFIEAEYYLQELMSLPVAGDTLIQVEYWLGLICFNQGRYSEAEGHLDKVVDNPSSSRKPLFRQALFLLAESRLKLVDYQGARQDYLAFTLPDYLPMTPCPRMCCVG